MPNGSSNQYLQFLLKTYFEKTSLLGAITKNTIFFTPTVGQKNESPPTKLFPSLY